MFNLDEAIFLHTGHGTHSFHSYEVTKVCSSFHFGKRVQFRQVHLSFFSQASFGQCSSSCDHSFSFLWGPWEHIRHLLSRDRLPFTAVYLGTIVATLYCSVGVSDTP